MEILEFDDGSGWTSVKLSGGQGLVPTSYLEILDDGEGRGKVHRYRQERS